MPPLIDLFLHLDKHLAELVQSMGGAVYAILATIVFCETGLVVTPFLPGDSLLFAAGSLAGIGALSLPVLLIVLGIAAIAGDTVNYWIGRRLGQSAIEGRLSKWVNPKHILKTQQFYQKHGAKMIMLARFIPIMRTFAPFVAGIGRMQYSVFLTYNVLGGIIWVSLFTLLGYWFGNIAWVKDHFSVMILAIIAISLIPVLIDVIQTLRHREDDKPATS